MKWLIFENQHTIIQTESMAHWVWGKWYIKSILTSRHNIKNWFWSIQPSWNAIKKGWVCKPDLKEKKILGKLFFNEWATRCLLYQVLIIFEDWKIKVPSYGSWKTNFQLTILRNNNRNSNNPTFNFKIPSN